jgi:hypothetical protein
MSFYFFRQLVVKISVQLSDNTLFFRILLKFVRNFQVARLLKYAVRHGIITLSEARQMP